MVSIKVWLIIGGIVILLLAGTGLYLYTSGFSLSDFFEGKGGVTDIIISPPSPKQIDKLFTAFVYIPLLDYSKGCLKRDLGCIATQDVGKMVVKGVCFRQYEVGIGYNAVTELFPKYLDAACQNQSELMPKPEILSTNTVDSEALGEYTRLDCDVWDQDSPVGRKSHKFLKEQLIQDGQWQSITDNSQKVLMSYLRVYCPGEELAQSN